MKYLLPEFIFFPISLVPTNLIKPFERSFSGDTSSEIFSSHDKKAFLGQITINEFKFKNCLRYVNTHKVT